MPEDNPAKAIGGKKYSFPKNKIKALVLEDPHSDAVDKFKKEGYLIESIPKGLTEDELIEKIRDATILCIRSKTIVTKKVLENAKKLLAVGAYCIGTDQIDVKACANKGIPVFNAPYANTRSVVELTVGEIIMLLRKTFQKSEQMHKGKWKKESWGCFEVRGKTLGIIGYGNIGSQVSVLAESLGMNVCYYDVIEKLSFGNAKKCASMEELLQKSDAVTVHVDGRKSNKTMIGEKELKLMKDKAVFLNASRGAVVDLNALAKFIESGKIMGAAVDVFPNEPKSNKEAFSSPLQNLPNVILTPHIGGSTLEAQQNIANFVTNNLINFINCGDTTFSVGFPSLHLEQLRGAHRFIHIHKNIPGVLAQINSVFAKNNLNILAQYLKTHDEVGYVISDVSLGYDKNVVEELKNIPATIRLRVLY